MSTYKPSGYIPLTQTAGEGIEGDGGILVPVTTATKRELDTVNYKPRSFWRDMLPYTGQRHWADAIECWRQMLQVIFFPNVIWLVLV